MKIYTRASLLISTFFFCSLTGLHGQSNFKYDGVWHQGSENQKLWADADWDSFNSKIKEFQRQGYLLVDIETILQGGRLRYFGVWRQTNEEHKLVRDVKWKEFKKKASQYRKQGFRLKDIEIYIVKGNKKFTGIWTRGDHQEKLVFDENWKSFKEAWYEYNKKNFRLIDIETYVLRGERKFAGLWQEGFNNDLLLIGLTQKTLAELTKRLEDNRMRIADIEKYELRKGVERYIALWYREDGREEWNLNETWDIFLSNNKKWVNNGSTLVDIEAFFSGTNTPLKKRPAAKKTVGSSQKRHGKDSSIPDSKKVETGKASYYSNKFQGRKTASGELYDKDKMTAAHRTHPFGTLVRVTNVANGLSVIVRVNDRGPHVPSRVIDLTEAAAIKIDAIRSGIIDVKVEVVTDDQIQKE